MADGHSLPWLATVSIGGQLRDRARITSTVKSGTRVEGGYQRQTVIGPWFRCSYDPGDESESRSDGGVRRRRSGATLVTGRRATDGAAIELEATDAVEIDSQRYGTVRLDVVGTPERLVRGRSRIGWLVRLGKVDRKAPG